MGEGEHAGVRLTYVTEPDRRGTAGAIRFAADALGDDLDERFLALNGDVLTDLDLTALMNAHREREARATIALYPVEDSSAYGLVSVDGGGRVTEFVEKTGEAVPGEVNAGAYFLERSVLDLIPPEREVSIEREVFPLLVGDGLGALRLDGYWMDIGTPERYLQASWDILEGRVETQVRPTAPGLLVGAGAEIDRRRHGRAPRRDLPRLPDRRRGGGARLGPARRLRASAPAPGSAAPCSPPGVTVDAGAGLADARHRPE